MTPRALILTYHAIAAGPPPLFVEPTLLARQLDCIIDSGANVLTVSELASTLRAGTLPPRAVVLTFDDAFASVADAAAPLLAERGLHATLFCVSGHLGGLSNWPSQPLSAPRLPLADAAALSELAAAGWEIGSHGVSHEPLARLSADARRRELLESREVLEQALGVAVRSFAFPYGAVPAGSRDSLREAGYDAACTTRIASVSVVADPLALPRVDAHYLRRPAILEAVLVGTALGYLGTRRIAARARRLVVRDYESTETTR